MGRAEAAAMIPGLALLWAAGLGGAAPSTPRLRLSFQELQARHGLRTFRLERTCCYEALLLDEERGRLFVGAENHVASLSLDNISKRAKKLAWPARVEWREECNWAGKDIGFRKNFRKLVKDIGCLPYLRVSGQHTCSEDTSRSASASHNVEATSMFQL